MNRLLSHRYVQYRNTSLHLLQVLPCTHPVAALELAPIAFLGDDVEDFAAGVLSDLFGERGGRFADFQHIAGHCVCRAFVGWFGGGCGSRCRNRCSDAICEANPAGCTDSAPILCADAFDFVDGVCDVVFCAVFLGDCIAHTCACSDIQVLARVVCADNRFSFLCAVQLLGVCAFCVFHTAIVGRIDAGRGGLPCTNLIVQVSAEAVTCVAHYADFRTDGNSLSLADGDRLQMCVVVAAVVVVSYDNQIAVGLCSGLCPVAVKTVFNIVTA